MTGRIFEAGHTTAPDHMPDRAQVSACIQGGVHTRRRQRFPRPLPKRLKHGTEPPVQTLIPKIASGGFRFHPALPHVRTSCIRCHMTNHDYIVVAKTKTGS